MMNMEEYKRTLFNLNTSYNEMIEQQSIPKYLYKYQSFGSNDGEENKYWKKNIRGEFHLSLASEFEDSYDSAPYINYKDVNNEVQRILRIITNNKINENDLQKIEGSANKEITSEYLQGIKENFQNKIRIGCFTQSSDNSRMWKKYANDETGFCLQYLTKKNSLFTNSTLPVLYSEKQYNLSSSLAHVIVKEVIQENITEYQRYKINQCIFKGTYIPVFVKGKELWGFEDEYRMFLLDHRTTVSGMLEAKKILDKNCNINLSKSITAIYLGKNFDNNNNCKEIRKEIIEIAKEMNIKVFKKSYINGKNINIRLL